MGKDVIFFGGGASHGSEPAARTPPLGEALFDELVAFAPSTWGALPHPWTSRFRSDFEPAMESFISSGGFGAPLQWDMAEYFYTQFATTPQSAYVSVLSALAPKMDRYAYVTINYELLLFQARALAGIPVNDLVVCLPHGNASLCCVGITATPGIRFIGRLATGGKVRVFRDIRDFRNEKVKNVFPPVMSYFEPNKFTVSCANYIHTQRRWFAELVASAHKIVIVGVRVHPVDKHIWEPLARTNAAITYISGPGSTTEFLEWASHEGRSGDNAVPKYFREGIDDLVAFLS